MNDHLSHPGAMELFTPTGPCESEVPSVPVQLFSGSTYLTSPPFEPPRRKIPRRCVKTWGLVRKPQTLHRIRGRSSRRGRSGNPLNIDHRRAETATTTNRKLSTSGTEVADVRRTEVAPKPKPNHGWRVRSGGGSVWWGFRWDLAAKSAGLDFGA